MAQYRKKPVTIEAVRFDGVEQVDDIPEPMFEGSFDIMPEWLTDAMAKQEDQDGAAFVEIDDLCIRTLEGTLTASPGDFIIRGVQGELYPCKPDIFAATYDAVDVAGQRVLAGGYPDVEPHAPTIGRTELSGETA